MGVGGQGLSLTVASALCTVGAVIRDSGSPSVTTSLILFLLHHLSRML